MNRQQAIEYVSQHYPYDYDSDFCQIVALRHQAVMLPEYGVDGSIRDESEWAYFDMSGKIDTGMYGDIYYFGRTKR